MPFLYYQQLRLIYSRHGNSGVDKGKWDSWRSLVTKQRSAWRISLCLWETILWPPEVYRGCKHQGQARECCSFFGNGIIALNEDFIGRNGRISDSYTEANISCNRCKRNVSPLQKLQRISRILVKEKQSGRCLFFLFNCYVVFLIVVFPIIFVCV